MANLVFSLQPTFTQGLILGQVSILALLVVILKYLFFDSAQHPFETISYQPREAHRAPIHNGDSAPYLKKEESIDGDSESTEWLNALIQQVADVYRSKLRGDSIGPEGEEVARKRVEEYANRIRPAGFLDHITIHSVDLGVSGPRLSNARLNQSQVSVMNYSEFDVTYTDTISISLSTSYLFNYPMTSFARLPVSLTISLSKFKSSIIITPPLPSSPSPVLTITLPQNFTLDLTTTSLMGSRAKLANVPKLHELIQHQVRRILASRATWRVPLPGLMTAIKVQDETHTMKEERL
ncbi:hypothetical protein BDN72DRAFT_754864 [Pluteus cervinus]|uniref:Uncharacterized protein n=1 Tax=Pluteus cervinus TaxID=181527 RepID=A0ACD3BFQ7_9AGAR|nr:hypothetical protein BDN72DRAFT_754864 [Pluteus cervinus]